MADPVDSRVLPGRRLGWIKEIDRDRGYAFVTGMDGEEYFAHARNFGARHWKDLVERDTVSFEAVDTIKGWRAARVQPATKQEDGAIHDHKEAAGNR